MNADSVLSALAAYAPRIVLFFVVLFAGWIVAGWTGRLVRRSLEQAEFDATLTKFFAGASRILIIVLTIVALLGYLGVATASFAAVIGAAGLAIGLALQGTLGHFASGVLLLAFRPFKVGDFVVIGGESGTVDEIDLFVTKIDTPEKQRVIIPNGKVFGDTIRNVTFHPVRRVEVLVGTDYSADLDTVRSVLEQVPARVDGVREDPAPQIFLADLGDSSINWKVRVWAENSAYWDVHQRTTREIKRALDDAGIGIPFPQRDLHLYNES